MSEIKKIEEMIKKSGNNFHRKVLNYLKTQGWTVLISPYYNDNISDKPRELDIIAEKAFQSYDSMGRERGTINIKLFVECKYINQNIVFWFHNKDTVQAKKLLSSSTPLRENNTFINEHHYLKNNSEVAKLFTSENNNNVENEPIYKALNQSLNAMIYFRKQDSIIPLAPIQRVLATVCYPVIICNNFHQFYKVEMDSTEEEKPLLLADDYFQLEVNYAYTDIKEKHQNEYFLIDVVDFTKMDKFLVSLQSDVEAINMVI